jgi:glucose-1-phosphate thymidylyltransferase
MRAILLCAGFATRLYPLTRDFPKPLLEVAGRPLVEDLLEQLLATGRIDAVTVVSNHRFVERFAAWTRVVGERHPDLRIELLDDGARDAASRQGALRDLSLAVTARAVGDTTLVAAGDTTLVAAGDTTLVAAGDNLFRFDLGAFLADHARRPRNLILVERESDPARLRRSGVVELSEPGRVLRFVEKPARPASGLACPPLYLLERSALARLPEFLAEVPGADPPGQFIAWLVEREAVFAHAMRGSRYDVGDVASYRAAEVWLRELERGG